MEEGTEFIERKILTGLVTSTEFLREMAGDSFDVELLVATPARTVARWCLDYYSEFSRAAGSADFESLFRTKTKTLSKSEVSDMEELLAELSQEYTKEAPSLDYLLSSTRTYLRIRSITVLGERLLQSAEKKGGIEEADAALTEFLAAESRKSKASAINVFDSSNVHRAFKHPARSLIPFGGTLEKFWGHQFVRDAFVGFLATEKRGKSWNLQEIGVRSTSAGLNAAIFQAGDMSEAQAMMRLYMRISSKPAPYRSETEEDEDSESHGPSFYWAPELDCVHNQTGTCEYFSSKQENSKQEPVMSLDAYKEAKEDGTLADKLKDVFGQKKTWDTCRNCRDKFQPSVCFRKKEVNRVLDEREVRRGLHKWRQHSRGKLFLATYANETLSVSEITSRLDEWERAERIKIDVVVIDYADILAPDADYSRLEPRHQINKTWQRLRAMSEKRNCLVVTATQAAASAYDKKTLRMSDFSEDKRKYAHVTALYGLNQTAHEKRMGILRINPIVVRESDYDSSHTVSVLQCLTIGRPIVTSF
jgi:hypothetical protein